MRWSSALLVLRRSQERTLAAQEGKGYSSTRRLPNNLVAGATANGERDCVLRSPALGFEH